MDCIDAYISMNENLINVTKNSLINGNITIQARSQMFINDYEKWIECIGDCSEIILYQTALEEYATALMFAVQGLYRQAFASLRFCLEYTLFAVYISANELKFRTWRNGEMDISWSALTDVNTGIFSRLFINAFAPEFNDKAYELQNIAKAVYRECSEYVHGNYKTTIILPEHIKYDDILFHTVHEKADSIKYLISMAFFIRYKDLLRDPSLLKELEQPIMSNIGTIPVVQELYTKI